MTQTAVVYIVDDNDEVTKSLDWLLSSVGYQVKCFSSAESFLQAFQPTQPSCIILDVRMPSMSGLELQDKLHEQNHRVPIIFMTGHGNIPMTVRAMKAGAMDFLTKPVNNQLLLDVVSKAIRADCNRLEVTDNKE